MPRRTGSYSKRIRSYSSLDEGRFILFPPIASIDGRSSSAGARKEMALPVHDYHAVDDIPAVNTSQSKDSGSSLIDDFRYS